MHVWKLTEQACDRGCLLPAVKHGVGCHGITALSLFSAGLIVALKRSNYDSSIEEFFMNRILDFILCCRLCFPQEMKNCGMLMLQFMQRNLFNHDLMDMSMT